MNEGHRTKWLGRLVFEPVSWCQFDEQFAPPGWTKGRDKPEPIVFYKYTGMQYAVSLDDFTASVAMSADYDSAKNQRDNSL